MGNGLLNIFRAYERSFKRHPVITLAITNGCLKCLGDFLAQLIPPLEAGQPLSQFQLQYDRSLRFFFFGFCFGPLTGKWHEFLEHFIPFVHLPSRVPLNPPPSPGFRPSVDAEKANWQPYRRPSKTFIDAPFPSPARSTFAVPSTGSRTRQLIKRVLLDQLIMSPFFIFCFLTCMALLEGLTIAETRQRISHLYFHILLANWRIWPFIQFINFWFMPLQFRVPWQGSCGVLWTIYLSLSTHPTASPAASAITASAIVGAAVQVAAVLNPTEAPKAGLRDTAHRMARVVAQRAAQAAAAGKVDVDVGGT